MVTRGNPDGHVVLRGGSDGPNYAPAQVAETERLLAKAGLPQGILIDCSHDNSAKRPRAPTRKSCAKSWGRSRKPVTASITGAMVESNLAAGNQPLPAAEGKSCATGVSITDACIDWPTTESLIQAKSTPPSRRVSPPTGSDFPLAIGRRVIRA